MAPLCLTPHGIPALDVYQFFSTATDANAQKYRVAKLLGPRNYHAVNNTYYIQTSSQLEEFVALLKPQARNGETTAQLRSRFFSENAGAVQQLSEFMAHGEYQRMQCNPVEVLCFTGLSVLWESVL